MAALGVHVRFGALSLFAVSMAFLVPTAAAQTPDSEARGDASVRERQRSDYDPLGMRLGGFMLHATLDLAVATTDNVFAEEVTPESDTFFIIAPSATLTSTWSRHALAFAAGLQNASYQEFSNEDANTGYASVSGRLDIGSRSSVRGSAGIVNAVASRNDPDAQTFGDPVDVDSVLLSLGAEHRFTRFRVSGDVTHSETDYSGGLVSQDFRDNEEIAFTGRVRFDFTPRLGGIFEVRADERDYTDPTTNDSDGVAYLAGIGINFTDVLQGEVLAGVFERDYANGDSNSGTAWSTNLTWYVTRLTNVDFSANRRGEDVSGNVSTPFTTERYAVRVDHELRRNIILGAGVNGGTLDYEVIDRNDTFFGGFVGADYLVNRRVVLYGTYDYAQVESEGVDRYRDFEANAFRVGVRLRL
jgi:hypothetical protein